MSRHLLVLLALVACNSDPDVDGDGLTLSQEEELGSNPDLADSDGDGLNDKAEIDGGSDPGAIDTDGDGLRDGEEADHGADPTLADSDEDGYSDRDEVFTGHDPADPADRIYTGNWPYVYDKTAIARNSGDFRQIGNTFHRLKLVDQHGQEVDLYDFYNADKPIVIDISAEWCPPCRAMAEWIEGGDDAAGFGSLWSHGPKAIKQEKVYWLTVLDENADYTPADPTLPARWVEDFPSKKIAALADTNYTAGDYTGRMWWPYLILLEPDLTVSAANDPGENFGASDLVLTELNNRFPGN